MELASYFHLDKIYVKKFNQGMLKVTLKLIHPISTVCLTFLGKIISIMIYLLLRLYHC